MHMNVYYALLISIGSEGGYSMLNLKNFSNF